MANIGEPLKEVEFEPIEVPAEPPATPAETPAEEPVPV